MNSKPLSAIEISQRTKLQPIEAVAAKLGVRHETPQAILVRRGKAVWSASHFRVNAASIEKALRS